MCDYTGHEFGAHYPDSVCIDGKLWDADSGYPASDPDFWHYTRGGDIPCPQCDHEGYKEYYADDICEDCGNGLNKPGAHDKNGDCVKPALVEAVEP